MIASATRGGRVAMMVPRLVFFLGLIVAAIYAGLANLDLPLLLCGIEAVESQGACADIAHYAGWHAVLVTVTLAMIGGLFLIDLGRGLVGGIALLFAVATVAVIGLWLSAYFTDAQGIARARARRSAGRPGRQPPGALRRPAFLLACTIL